MQLGIGREARPEGFQILKAQLLRNHQHLRLVALHLVETYLVNLLGGQIRGRLAANLEGVILCSAGQRPDARLRATGGNVADLKETRKAQVGRQDFLADYGEHFCLDALLLGWSYRGGKLLERRGQRRSFWRL